MKFVKMNEPLCFYRKTTLKIVSRSIDLFNASMCVEQGRIKEGIKGKRGHKLA